MHQNMIYRFFLLFVLLATFWYSGQALYRYYGFARLTAQARPDSIEWHVREKADDAFYLEASYGFTVQKNSFKGTTAWPKELYRNRFGAEKDTALRDKEEAVIWYDPASPTHSSLQKRFPLKECITAAFLWGLFLYFLWIGFYVTKFKT